MLKIKIICLYFFCIGLSITKVVGQEKFNILILNGKVIDGTGTTVVYADIGINGDRIAIIGDLKKYEANEIIDVKGLIVAPGFIDVHTHCDRALLKIPANPLSTVCFSIPNIVAYSFVVRVG